MTSVFSSSVIRQVLIKIYTPLSFNLSTPRSQIYKIFIFSYVKCLKIKRSNLNDSTDKEVSFLKMGTSQGFVTDSNVRTALLNSIILSARDKVQ